MSDLTEKWKAGELEEGYYYIKVNKTLSYVEIDYYHIFGGTRYWNGNDDEDVEEVLAPVPSYEEMQRLQKDAEQLDFYQDLSDTLSKECGFAREENARLKRLLKDVKEFIEEENPKDYTIMSERMDELLTKIEEVLK